MTACYFARSCFCSTYPRLVYQRVNGVVGLFHTSSALYCIYCHADDAEDSVGYKKDFPCDSQFRDSVLLTVLSLLRADHDGEGEVEERSHHIQQPTAT